MLPVTNFTPSGTYQIGAVKILPRADNDELLERFQNTSVSVYSNEISARHCGTITELQSGDWPNSQTYYVDCGGVSGDMVYLTDLDTADCCGLNIAEVEIYQLLPRECTVLFSSYLVIWAAQIVDGDFWVAQRPQPH